MGLFSSRTLIDVNIAGTSKITPLHIAAKYNKLVAVQTLITYNANVQVKDIDNNTSLHYAAKAGHLDICKVCTVNYNNHRGMPYLPAVYLDSLN